MNYRLFMMAAAVIFASGAYATGHTESEPNDNKGSANPFVLVNGDTITGTSTTTLNADFDYYFLQTTAAPLGLYEHTLTTPTPTAGLLQGSIRGLLVAGGTGGATSGTITPGSDSGLQNTTLLRTTQRWYGFGKAEKLYWSMVGDGSTVDPYTATYAVVPVTPVDLGTFAPGTIDITTFDRAKAPNGASTSYTDTEMTLYDANFQTQPLWNNDDWFPASSIHPFHSELHPTLPAGTYYLAIAQFNLSVPFAADATNEGGPNDTVSDFEDIVVQSNGSLTQGSPAIQIKLSFGVTDANGTVEFDATKPSRCGVYWAKFTVGASNSGVQGHVGLENWVGATAGYPVTFEVEDSSATIVDTVTSNLDADGNYSFATTAPNGTYSVYAKGATFLRKKVANVTITGGSATGVDFNLLNGNCENSDNVVDISDYLILVGHFDQTSSDAGWDPQADVDGSGQVDLSDYLALVQNFDVSGD